MELRNGKPGRGLQYSSMFYFAKNFQYRLSWLSSSVVVLGRRVYNQLLCINQSIKMRHWMAFYQESNESSQLQRIGSSSSFL